MSDSDNDDDGGGDDDDDDDNDDDADDDDQCGDSLIQNSLQRLPFNSAMYV